MLPAAYQFPAALFLLVSGLVACFLGYRLFRVVLATVGLIFGVFIATSFFGVSDTGPMLVAGAVGGILGGIVLFFAYFVGVSLVGAALGALVANLVFAAGEADPNIYVVIALSVVGAAVAMYLQRYVLIVGTAFFGAWLAILGTAAILADRSALAEAVRRDVWVVYPLNPAPGQQWVPIVWVVLGLLGVMVQMGYTGGERGRVHRKKKPAPASA